MIDFTPTDEQRLIAGTAGEFARRVLLPRAAERDRRGEFPESELRELGRLGLLAVNVPASLGGSEAGVVAYSLAMEEIAAVDASVAVAMAVTNMVAEIVVRFGTDEQKARHVPRLASGEYVAGAFALSEPQAGSDPSAMTTTATRTGRGFRLDGNKQWITSGDRAGLLVVWARTDPAAGHKGISAFLVEKSAPGLTAGRHEDKLGLRGSTTVPLVLDGVEVGEDALLGGLGSGFKIAMAALDGGRIGIGSQAVGVGRAALEAALAYVKQRHQFGQALAAFQATQFKLADMATELDAARLLAHRAAWLKEQGVAFSRQAAMAKLYASEAAGRICDAAIQLHGGYGYTRDYPVERFGRDARVQRIYEGTSEIQRLVIARALLQDVAQGS
jgi:alkylation response protein AidB-like acyl-CoA dehydrogenase